MQTCIIIRLFIRTGPECDTHLHRKLLVGTSGKMCAQPRKIDRDEYAPLFTFRPHTDDVVVNAKPTGATGGAAAAILIRSINCVRFVRATRVLCIGQSRHLVMYTTHIYKQANTHTRSLALPLRDTASMLSSSSSS